MANPVKLENVKINKDEISSYLINGGIEITDVPMRGRLRGKDGIQDYSIRVAFCNPRPSSEYSRELEKYVPTNKAWVVDLIYFYDEITSRGKRSKCDIREGISVNAEGLVNIDKKKFYIGDYSRITKKLNIQTLKDM